MSFVTVLLIDPALVPPRKGKTKLSFDGVEYILEHPLRADTLRSNEQQVVRLT